MTDLETALTLLDSYIDRYMRATGAPGVAVAVTDREKLLHVATHGLADVAARVPVSADTLFEIGSISKSFTTIALLQLREAGRLDLHAPVARYLPWFHVPSRYEPITLHHLMSHTAGIVRGSDLSTEARYEAWALRETEATAPPGERFYYSNAGYKVLGLVLEELLGQSYEEIIRERILDRLGMEATEAVITHETRKRLAVGYEAFYDDRPLPAGGPFAPATWFETATADGSIAATAADLAAYVRMLINRGRGPDGRLLSEESFCMMTQAIIQTDDTERDTFYGYGLNIHQTEERAWIGHDGGMVGYYSAMLADLDDGRGIVVLTNGPGEPGELAQIGLRLLNAAGRNQELPPCPPPADPHRVQNAADYAGTYQSEARAFTLTNGGERLLMHYGDEQIPLERRDEEDCFYVTHPDWALFVLRFQRQEDQVVGVFHGPDVYTHQRYTNPTAFDSSPEWAAYPGHYRAHNPWHSNFRVVLRQGGLVLIEPWGEECELISLGNGHFRVGSTEYSPERIAFDTIIDGQAVRANLSGCHYYRTFTP